MKFLPTRSHRHRVAAVATAAVVALGGGTAAVVAATTTSAPAGTVTLAAATAPAAAKPGVHHPRGLLARTDHATIELKVKGQWVTYDLDRGKVTAVSATSITLARPDGQSVTLTIDSATRFGHKLSAAAITVGARATVISDGGTARRVVQVLHPARKAAAPATTAAA